MTSLRNLFADHTVQLQFHGGHLTAFIVVMSYTRRDGQD
jgi:hypothetical protein